MRALEPRKTGYATNARDGVQSYYEIFGPASARHTILFFPTWSLVHSRVWKMQIPYFARRGFQIITFDGRGNGKSGRPESGYTTADYVLDALAVLDTIGAEQVSLVTLSAGSRPGAQLAAEHPGRIDSFVMIAPAVRLEGAARVDLEPFLSEPPNREGWNKYNAVHWREEYRDFVEWFSGEIFSEPHSTKPVDDVVGWAMETTPEVLVATTVDSLTPRMAEFCKSVQCPTLIIHGTDDAVIPFDNSKAVQETIPGSELFAIEGGGHAPNARDPVMVNLMIHEFLDRHQGRAQRVELSRASA